jgi:hypothetical protein
VPYQEMVGEFMSADEAEGQWWNLSTCVLVDEHGNEIPSDVDYSGEWVCFREPMKIQDDLQLVIAHLLGGTNGFDFDMDYEPEEIKAIVKRAVTVALEIEAQTKAVREAAPRHTKD